MHIPVTRAYTSIYKIPFGSFRGSAWARKVARPDEKISTSPSYNTVGSD